MDEIVDEVPRRGIQPHHPLPSHAHSLPTYTGQVKWWNDKLGFGFATVTEGPSVAMKGRDVFVHHTGIAAPANTFRSLRKNERVTFNLSYNKNRSGDQAVNVRHIA